MVIHNKNNNRSLSSLLNCFIIISVVLAVGSLLSVKGARAIDNPLEADSFVELVEDIANIVAIIGGIVAVIFIILSGSMFIFARGDEQKLKTAKSMFMWTVIGSGILLGAWAIANAVIEIIRSLG